jgi:hypothetical protein
MSDHRRTIALKVGNVTIRTRHFEPFVPFCGYPFRYLG